MSLKDLAQQMKSRGRKGDTELIHMTRGEVAGLQQLAEAAGGTLTRNPDTGLPEAFHLRSILPAILGFGLTAATGGAATPLMAGLGVGGFEALRTGDIGRGLMAGLGAAGGAGLGAGLTGAGAGAAQANALSNLGPEALANQTAPGLLQAQATKDFMAQPMLTQMGQGAQALMQPGGAGQFVQSLGGGMGALKTGAMAAAPMMYDAMMPPRMSQDQEDDAVLPRYDYTAGLTGDYYQPGQGTFERRYFTDPTFTRRAAAGGIMQLARGGALDLQDGDFIVPADVTAFAGGGSTDAGMQVLAKKIGAQPIRGPGTGLSDDIPARINGKQPARVANGEMLVRKPGKEGAKKLYAMMDNIREQATGKKKQIRPVNVDKALA
jgi:hypothetical protein